MYPFRIKIKEPELIKIYLRLEQDHIVEIPKNMSKKITWQLKPIRPDIHIGDDRRYNEKCMALKQGLKFEMTPLNKKKTSYKLKFHKVF